MKNTISDHQKKLLATLKKLPKKISVEAMQFFVSSFEKQGFTDKSFKRWQLRKADLMTAKKAKKQRGILILSGDLKRSLNAEVKGNAIIISTRSPYAEIHNEGLAMKNGKRMPQRRFVGNSEVLQKKIKALIEKELNQL